MARLDAARLGQVGLVGQVVRLGAPGWARLALDYPDMDLAIENEVCETSD